jgi:hypothetical protein
MQPSTDMSWKVSLSIVMCLGLLVLMIIGIMTGADHRIVIADAIGAMLAARVGLLARMVGKPSTGTWAVLILAGAFTVYLAETAHTRPWLLGLTLMATFTMAVVAVARAGTDRGKKPA